MTAAQQLVELVTVLTGAHSTVRIRAWDGSEAGPPDAAATVVVSSPVAVTRLLWAPHELGFGRAYVAGDLDVEGDLYTALRLPVVAGANPPSWREVAPAVLRLARQLGAVGRNPAPPAEEARLRGLLHSKRRDAEAIAHHYDVSNEFYEHVLGPTLVYSCAYWGAGATMLEQAQTDKLDLVARKLGLREGMRVLDVGCGWGSFAMHVAQRYGVHAVGITISQRQYDLASKRIANAGLADRVEIRLQDYRDINDGPFDAIASIGMAEHVGEKRLNEYATQLAGLLRPGGRLLNHAIAQPPGRRGSRRHSFIWHYVFPDGELLPVAKSVNALEQAGLEVRDVESLREHYALTLRQWVANLEANWDHAVHLTGEGRARVWRLYMAGSALAFEAGRIGIDQVLAVKRHGDGRSGVPLSRADLLGGAVSR